MADDNEQNDDYLNFGGESKIKSMIKEETLLFSDNIIKVNKYGMNQERVLLITDAAVYNLNSVKDKKLKRRIDITKIRGITTSQVSDELVLHGKDEEYDYLYVTPKKNRIICILEEVHECLTGEELEFAYLEVAQLKNVVTTKKAKAKNMQASRMNDSELSNIKEYIKTFCRKKGTTESDDEGVEEDVKEDKNNLLNYDEDDEDDAFIGNESYSSKDNIMKVSDFQFLKVLGVGKYATTYLAKHKEEYLAVKEYKKHIVMENDYLRNVKRELKVLANVKLENNNFIPQLKYTFQSPNGIYLAYPFYQGGDLYTYLSSKNGNSLEENEVKIIAAQIIQAISILHSDNIIYRNLKLENVLFDEKGFIKLVDFSKSYTMKFKDDLSSSFVGNLDYISPESIKCEGQTRSTDWWMLGILLYELLYGITPFSSDTFEQTCDRIVYSDFKFPEKKSPVSNEMKDLIRQLLNKNQKKRIGAGPDDAQELESHAAFKGINFDEVRELKIKPSFVPSLTGKEDLKYFDDQFLKMEINLEPYLSGFQNEIIQDAASEGKFKMFK
ncbi:MAG: protein kinase [archaeon]|nr:protein kinase [archaeon]